MMITIVTSGVTNVNRLFTKVNKNWKFKNYILMFWVIAFSGAEIS